MYMVYTDDSGDEESSLYTGLLVPVEKWSRVKEEWLKFRRWLFEKYRVPADYEWHTYKWLGVRGEPLTDDPDALINTSKNLRKELAEKAMIQVRRFNDFGVRVVTCETEGTNKAEAYAAMVREIDNLLGKQDAYGAIIVDGGADGQPDRQVRAAHRSLELSTRRVVEDGWLQPARDNQLVQVADLVVHCAYQAARKKPGREFMWDWYGTYVHEMEWECWCP